MDIVGRSLMLFTSGNYRVNNSNMTFALLFKFISHSQSVSILLSSALYLMFEDYNFFLPAQLAQIIVQLF